MEKLPIRGCHGLCQVGLHLDLVGREVQWWVKGDPTKWIWNAGAWGEFCLKQVSWRPPEVQHSPRALSCNFAFHWEGGRFSKWWPLCSHVTGQPLPSANSLNFIFTTLLFLWPRHSNGTLPLFWWKFDFIMRFTGKWHNNLPLTKASLAEGNKTR